jgi:hypothetical protein
MTNSEKAKSAVQDVMRMYTGTVWFAFLGWQLVTILYPSDGAGETSDSALAWAISDQRLAMALPKIPG